MKEHGLNAIRTASPITQSGLFSSPSRLLGEDYAPARSIYLTHIPAILVLTGLVTWIAGDEMAMVMAAAVASLVACY